MSTHYSINQQPAVLRVWAKHMAEEVRDMLEGTGAMLVYRGMSGIGAATALALALDELNVRVGMAYARKPKEDSHGRPLEYHFNSLADGERFKLVFVDDFIGLGHTRDKTLRTVLEHHKFRHAEGMDRDEYLQCLSRDGLTKRSIRGEFGDLLPDMGAFLAAKYVDSPMFQPYT